MRRNFLVLILVLGGIAAVGGCGESSDSNEEALTKAEFIEQGDQICRESTKQAEAEVEELAEKENFTFEENAIEEMEVAATEVFVPSLNRQAEELAALAAPEGDEEQVEEIVVSFEDAAAEIEGDPGLALEGEVLEESAEMAADYGFKVCGEG